MSTSNSEAKRICLFLPALNEGGAERVMVRLANAFSDKGYTTDLVAAQMKGPYLQEVSGNVNLIDLGSSRTFTSVLPLIRYLRKYRPHCLLSTLTHANIVATVAVKLSNVNTRVVLREAGLPTLDENQHLGNAPRGLFKAAKWVYPHADCIVGVSNGVISELKEMLAIEQKVGHTVIYNPVISKQLYQLASESINPDYESFFSKPVVLGVGRLSVEKDFHTLIKAFAEVRRTVDCHLLVLGSGALDADLRRCAADNGVADFVFMPGFISNPYPYIRRSTVYVLSSRSEGLPNALIEARALGVSVVSTSIVNGPSEILEDGKWGDLVPVGDHQAMAEKIAKALLSGAKPIPQADSWWQRFSESEVVSAYLKILQV